MHGSSGIEDIIARLTILIKKKKYTEEEQREIESLYPQVTQYVFTKRASCSDCYRDACVEMVVYLRKHRKFRDKLHFVLRNGVMIQLGGFGDSDFYTNANICDSVAIAYLRQHPENISFFQRYPANGQELSEPQKVEEDESNQSKKEIKQKN